MLYEFHLTTHPLSAAESEAFADCCRQLGGKAVLIALPHGAHTQQPMLSFVCDENTWAAARQRMVRLADALAVRGFPIVRQKTEIPADCAAAFYCTHPQHPAGYFEWHGKILIADLPFSGCLLKQHHEYCVYDSRIALDAGWI